jgi:hypothetical protein
MSRQHLLTLAAAAALGALAGPAHAQTFKPLEAVIVNPPSRPVPVTGTVKLDGGVGAITGTLKSGDKNVTVQELTLDVDTGVFQNDLTPQIDVSDYKEVRLTVARGSCSNCAAIEVMVFGYSASGQQFPIDQFMADQTGTNAFPFASKTYSVPGSKINLGLRTVAAPLNSSNSVRVTIIGRAN